LPSRGPIRLRAGTPATRMVGPRRPSEAPRRRLRRLDGADEAHLIPTTVLAVPSGNLVTQFAVARVTQGSLLSPSSRRGSSAVRLQRLWSRFGVDGAGAGDRPGRGLLRSGQRPGGLAGGAERHVLALGGDRHLATEDRRGQLLDGLAAGRTTDQGDAGGGGAG